MRRTIIIGAVVVGVISVLMVFYSLAYGQVLRRSRVMLGRDVLKQAHQQLAETGRIERSLSWRPFVFTNDVTVNGVTYRGSVATPLPPFDDEGIFVMTTNQTFIWVDKQQPPKVIPASGYTPRFFPEKF